MGIYNESQYLWQFLSILYKLLIYFHVPQFLTQANTWNLELLDIAQAQEKKIQYKLKNINETFHPSMFEVSHCIYSQLLDFMEIHLLYCIHGGERMILHDVVWDVFMIILKDARFHVS